MKIIALISHKGGAGKSLLSAHLSVAFEEAGIVTVLIDADRQQSVFEWGKQRATDAPIVVPGSADKLPDLLRRAEDGGAQILMLDTPAGSDRSVLTAATMADIILVPVRCDLFDIRALEHTRNLLRLARADEKSKVVLNAVPSAAVAKSAVPMIAQHGLRMCSVRIGEHRALSEALQTGQGITEFESQGVAARQIRELRDALCGELGVGEGKH